MAPPQGLVQFPGITQIESADFTLSHGIMPSVCTIKTIPHTNFIAQVGTLRFTFGQRVVSFPECAAQRADFRNSRGQTWTIKIFDRRWKWANGSIDGAYNRVLTDGTVDAETKKTPQELARLLLEAMGEQRFDISRLPNRTKPEVLWEAANPAQELDSLCRRLSCRIVLGIDNRVTIWPIGMGSELPILQLEINAGFGFTESVFPDEISIECGPTLYQSLLKLRAVGLDTDGQVKPIDDLNYKPAAGWDNEWYGTFAGVAAASRPLALDTVWRWYEVTQQAHGGLDPPGYRGDVIESVEQLFPIQDTQLETAADPRGNKRPRPAEVQGIFWSGGLDRANTPAGTRYTGGFTIDRERGIVKFSSPVTLAGDNGEIETPTELYLLTSYYIRQSKDQPPERFIVSQKLGAGNRKTGTFIVRRPEIVRTVQGRYDGIRLIQTLTNDASVIPEATHYLLTTIEQFRPKNSSDIQYDGIVPIQPDGAIHQVSFHVGKDGAWTRASRNMEWSPYVEPFERQQARLDVARVVNRLDILARGLLGAVRTILGQGGKS